MKKIIVKDTKNIPNQKIQITLFDDGELQFVLDNAHFNLDEEGVIALLNLLYEYV